jgi:hypothetical protein
MGTLILALICCVMLILIVREFTRTFGSRSRQNVRVVVDPQGDEWLTLPELAAHLETTEAEILNLIERDAIPFYVDAVLSRREPGAYRFKRDEIDDWVVG